MSAGNAWQSHAPVALSPARLRRIMMLGFKSLWMHRLRSGLTILGIVFGVCSVIAMLAVGEGASYEAQEQIRKLGSNNIILRSIKPINQDRPSQARQWVLEYGLTYLDLQKIRETIPGVTIVMPSRIVRDQVWNGVNRMDATIVGTVDWYPETRQLNLLQGRYFTPVEMEARSNVCVLTTKAVETLFPLSAPLGGKVRVGSDYYDVIGVIETESTGAAQSTGQGSGKAATAAPDIYIPLSAARHRFGEILVNRSSGSFEATRVELHEAYVRVDDQKDVEETALIIEEILKRDRRKTDFEIIVPLELLRQAERTKQIFNIVLGAIAAISLLVGGIGIMNIMLASVTERTREIGIRRALGARRRDIILQFLIETVILSGTGGLVGVAIGILIPVVITMFADMRTIVTPWAPILAFSISGMIGVVFGIYPALRAADMDPVQALRHE
ncbi:MAG: FtsX-like permease family protein [Candidatus Hydrogenedens sp.]|nr:FtsX-like permease family protein [Candidatus Hydrogenedens sp.]